MNVIEKIKEKTMGHKKGQVAGLAGAFVAIGVALLVGAFVALILSDVGDTMTADSAEANITDTGIDTVSDMTELVQPLGVVLVAVVIIGVLYGAFRLGGGGRR